MVRRRLHDPPVPSHPLALVRAMGRVGPQALVRLLAFLLVLAGPIGGPFAVAQPMPEAAPRPVDRPLAGEPAWAHAEGREWLWRELVVLFERNYWDARYRDWAAWGARHREAVVRAATRADLDAAFRAMVRELADDHSSWQGLPAERGSSFGATPDPDAPRLGLQLAYVAGRGLVVERVYPTTPAEEAGLRRADVITEVGDADLRRIGSLYEANTVLAAALGDGGATLRVERGRTVLEVDVRAAAVSLGDVASRPYAAMLDTTVGYLHVPSFNESGIGAAVHDALRDLVAAGAEALVLDLRGNLGGRLNEAGLTLGALLDDGAWARAVARGQIAWRATYAVERGTGDTSVGVSRLVHPDGTVLSEARVADPVKFHGPIVAIVGSESSSAAEIVPASLLDAGRARVVGEPTRGNVEAVRTHTLSDGSRVLVAIAQVEGATGTQFDGGVQPQVRARASVLDLARGSDPPVAEARRLLGGLPFTPGRLF
jgi:carboxyl-terminal processing protease